MPVNYVSFYDALRFANWLHNGQPTGAQDGTTTEDGAYDMSLGSSVVRKAGARAFLTSEDEWYKAAYYAGSDNYFDYPAGSDTETTCATPGATANTANCNSAVGDLTDAGSYTGSASPSGTFDQGGNVWEWNEALAGSSRGLRGGSFYGGPFDLAASCRLDNDPVSCSLCVPAAKPRARPPWEAACRVRTSRPCCW
jgi:formylglycine-generating enzyme required for sulfatase activity